MGVEISQVHKWFDSYIRGILYGVAAASPQTVFTFTHTLVALPSAIILQAGDSVAAGYFITGVYVDNITSNSFDVTFLVAPSANCTFYAIFIAPT